MCDRMISHKMMKSFELHLREDEKSCATVEKYMRDLKRFMIFAGEKSVDKQLVLEYKESLAKSYAASSANSMLAVINSFFRFSGWHDCCVKRLKTQAKVYCTEEKELTKEEYIRLVRTAERNGNERLSLIIQTICSTGIRVSELKYITVQALADGEAQVNCKGKIRMVFVVPQLRKKLKMYVRKAGITHGAVFVTKSGSPMDRSNIWREMKNLCRQAKVSPTKVFPHNLRHLFARIFYGLEKDIAKLADVLGHANLSTTRIYIVTTGTEHKRKMERMQLIL